jgi:uncharacterized membrane protein YgaE (UPF0421/DUF939 family)
MENTLSSDDIISNLKASIESLMAEIQKISTTFTNFTDANKFKEFEKTLHEKTTQLANCIRALKLQETLVREALNQAEGESPESQ